MPGVEPEAAAVLGLVIRLPERNPESGNPLLRAPVPYEPDLRARWRALNPQAIRE